MMIRIQDPEGAALALGQKNKSIACEANHLDAGDLLTVRVAHGVTFGATVGLYIHVCKIEHNEKEKAGWDFLILILETES
jgi:hypothetical protein